MFVNLTPHSINVYDNDGKRVVLEVAPSYRPARLNVETVQTSTLQGIPVKRTVYGEIRDLPEPQAGIYYIVSAMILAVVCAIRNDCVCPDTVTSAVRDYRGRIIGVKGFRVA